MSKQQTFMPVIEERNRGQHKKRTGQYEVWYRYVPTEKEKRRTVSDYWFERWARMRKYESKEIAEKNCADFTRKWNMGGTSNKKGFWEFEVRENLI